MQQFSKQKLRQQVLAELNGSIHTTDEDIYRAIDRVILQEGHSRYGTLLEKRELREQLFHSIRGFDVLEEYLRDDTVTEIMVIGASKIFIEQDGVLKKTDRSFCSEEEVYRLIDQMTAPLNRIVNESVPMVDGRLPDGSRVHVVLPPVSLEGPVITIRKFQKGGMTMKHLLDCGEFPPELAPVLACLVRGRYSVLISGATNSGKSSLLNALAEYLLPDERIITIEDSAELQFYHVDNLVRLETRNANAEGANAITMNDLIKASLRMRPTRIIVGEVRGEEAGALLNAASSGHSGLSTIHSSSCRNALRRLETMVLMGMDIPLRAVQGLIASAMDILIHLGRLSTGQRKILEIYELLDFDGQEYQLNPLFLYERGEGYEEGRLAAKGRLTRVERLKDYGQMQAYIQAMEVFDAEYDTR